MESPYTEEIYTMDKEETPLLYAAKSTLVVVLNVESII